MDKKKLIISIILMILIVIGIIVVCVKGFNVGLSLRPHNTLEYSFNKIYDLNEVEKICNEVFKNKKYRIRNVEIFGDRIYIESNTITEEEKTALLEKLDLINQDEDSNEDEEESVKYYFYYDSNIRLRDEIEQYIIPSVITIVILSVYVAIRYNKLNKGKFYITVLKMIFEMILLLLIILSIVAIFRIPVEKILFSILVFVELVYLTIKFGYMENKLNDIK